VTCRLLTVAFSFSEVNCLCMAVAAGIRVQEGTVETGSRGNGLAGVTYEITVTTSPVWF